MLIAIFFSLPLLHIQNLQSPTSFNINPSSVQAAVQNLPLEKGQPPNLVSVSSGNTENWGESNMADASPRTDISTDADTDEKNQRVMFVHILSCTSNIFLNFRKIVLFVKYLSSFIMLKIIFFNSL